MRTRRVTALSVLTGLLGASAACSAVLGITEFTPGDGGGPDATSTDDGPGDDGVSGQDGSGSDAECTSAPNGGGAAGCPCTQAGQLACNGNAQSQTLICSGGVWTVRSTCPAGQNCDSRAGAAQGTCAAIDTTCMTAMPNQAICSNSTTAVQCGPDLVSETPLATCSNQACVSGACTGVCTPNATRCSGNGVETCGADGQWSATVACSESCSDGGCGSFPSCLGGGPGAGTDCGGTGSDAGANDCCKSLEVPGGTFYRSYDGVSTGVGTNMSSPATLSGFRLDAYEVTVGRFRKFVGAVVGGWHPDPGSGRHTHLNGGSGLANVGGDAGPSETGWSMSWNSNLASSSAGWDSALAASSCPGTTWTAGASADEHLPINCITWYEAYAFCIWDGGFLPSEAEWNYAASGGSEQRVYPWSSPAMSTTIDCTYANYTQTLEGGASQACSSTGASDVGSEAPKGDGKWGQSDLAGNVWEWTLDSFATYVTPCADCANVATLTSRVARGGSFDITQPKLLTTSYRASPTATSRDRSYGVRCARIP